GESMMPTLRPGDRVIFHPLDRERHRKGDPKAEDGDVVFVRFSAEVGDGCTIARVYSQSDGTLQFRKDNPHFAPRTVPREHVVQMAVFVQLRRERL
ncbi:MAG: S24 family peptidase, partial [Phycisphaeraceae bacterium]|nr:S24 family peptidase [Phycisphaeraceae bacterium]